MSTETELIAIEETAAAWMVERDRGLSGERERELSRWLEADARQAAVFRALVETWTLLGEAQPIAVDFRESVSAWPRRRRRWVPVTLAAAAMAVACLGAWRFVEAARAGTAGPFAIASATEIGVLRKIPLPDGSVIQLNTDSSVDVRFTAEERRVALIRGEAHFSVTKNRERPFIVSVGGVDVRVVGTVFNVRLRNETVDVLVTEGTVRVGESDVVAASGTKVAAAGPTHSEVTAGQKLSIDLQAPTVSRATREELSVMEVKQALAWQSRRLDFDATPLEEIVAEMNRYNRHKLVIADSRLTTRQFGGSFPAGDYETIVRMLETNFGVVAERKGGETWLRLKATAP